MRDRHQTNCFQGGLGSISGLVVFFEQELAGESGKDPVVTKYALLITPKGQSVRKRRTRRMNRKFDVEIRPSPIERTNEQHAPRRRRRDLN
jgi:hypothetical protein